MTKKPDPVKEDIKAEKIAKDNESKRVSPDHPLGTENQGEETDFYQRQRDASPDGMTPQERDQAQKGAPGALRQTSPDGEKLGEARDYANPIGGTEQSGN